MRISDRVTKCIGFVSRDSDPLIYCGTVFFVGIPYDERSGLLVMVTAKHVAQDIGDRDFVIAVNARDGAPRFMKSGGDARWFYHPDDQTTDVAVMPLASPRSPDYDIQHIPICDFATDDAIKEHQIGLGDEIIAVGLFTKYFGKSTLIPIVRTGNIAMMPSEPVPTIDGEAEVYLAEGRSIGGLSGSPVFCRSTVNMEGRTADGEPARISGLGRMHLLGLMQGHWEISPKLEAAEQQEAVNMGISVVVPAKKILEVINGPEFSKLCDAALRRSS